MSPESKTGDERVEKNLRRGYFGLVVGDPSVRESSGEIVAAARRVDDAVETLQRTPHGLNRDGFEDVDPGGGSDRESAIAIQRHRRVRPHRKNDADRRHVGLAVNSHDDALDRILSSSAEIITITIIIIIWLMLMPIGRLHARIVRNIL